MLTPNSPWSRLQHIVKLYREQQPWVVVDTISVIAPTVGVDDLEEAIRLRHGPSAEYGLLRGLFSDGDVGHLLPGLHREFYRCGMPLTGSFYESRLRALDLLIDRIREVGLFDDGHAADKVFPWVARELSKLTKALIRDQFRSAEEHPDQVEYDDYAEALDQLRRKGSAIAQWAKLNRVDINRLSLAEVLEAIKGFRVSIDVRQGRVVYEYEDGWTVQELRSKRELEDEGKAMSHCVGSYCEAVANGESLIYSLRDAEGQPHVTFERNPTWGAWDQIYGPQNETPAPEYAPRIAEFLRAYPEIVEASVRDGATWVADSGTPDIGAILRFGIDANGLNLVGASASGDIQDLEGTDLTDAVLGDSTFYGWYEGVSFRNASLYQSVLQHGYFGDCDMAHVNLEWAQCVDAVFERCNLSGAHLGGTRIERVKLWDCDLSRSRWTHRAELRESSLHRCDFADAKLLRVSLMDTVFEHCKFAGVVVAETTFVAFCTLTSCDLSGMSVADARRLIAGAIDGGDNKLPLGVRWPEKRQ